MGQVHGDRIRVIDSADPLPVHVPECDGLITARPGVALAVRTADCVPLFFVDPVRRVIGAAHAGWRGMAAWLREQGKGMIAEFHSAPRDRGGSGAIVVFLRQRTEKLIPQKPVDRRRTKR